MFEKQEKIINRNIFLLSADISTNLQFLNISKISIVNRTSPKIQFEILYIVLVNLLRGSGLCFEISIKANISIFTLSFTYEVLLLQPKGILTFLAEMRVLDDYNKRSSQAHFVV